MDISDALAPSSDQLDAVELVKPRTFTIDNGSRLGKREGKTVAEIRLVDFDRVWRPSKGMLDVLAKCWGTDGSAWVGHRVTLYNDPEVMYGRDKTGGVRISHLSHIQGVQNVTIRAGGGRTKQWKVKPLEDAPAPQPARDYLAEVDMATDSDELRVLWRSAKEAGAMTDELNARIMAAQKALQEAETDA